MEIEAIRNTLRLFNERLKEWTATIDQKSCEARPYLSAFITAEDYCLDFNYTNTVERLYGRPNGYKVLHIHGDDETFVIAGHSQPIGPDVEYHDPVQFEFDGEHMNQKIVDDPAVDREDNLRRIAANSVPKYIHKDIQDIISHNRPYFDKYRHVESIIILGWSLG